MFMQTDCCYFGWGWLFLDRSLSSCSLYAPSCIYIWAIAFLTSTLPPTPLAPLPDWKTMELLGVSYKNWGCRCGYGRKSMEFFGGGASISTKFFRGTPIFFRVRQGVTKISSCGVNITSKQGIKQLGNSIGFIFLLYSFKSMPGEIPGPCLLMTGPTFLILFLMEAFRGECKFFYLKG